MAVAVVQDRANSGAIVENCIGRKDIIYYGKRVREGGIIFNIFLPWNINYLIIVSILISSNNVNKR